MEMDREAIELCRQNTDGLENLNKKERERDPHLVFLIQFRVATTLPVLFLFKVARFSLPHNT